MPLLAVYSATKAALSAAAAALAWEMRPHGVRVVAAHPGPVATPFAAALGTGQVRCQPQHVLLLAAAAERPPPPLAHALLQFASISRAMALDPKDAAAAVLGAASGWGVWVDVGWAACLLRLLVKLVDVNALFWGLSWVYHHSADWKAARRRLRAG